MVVLTRRSLPAILATTLRKYTCNDQTRTDKLKADFYKLRGGYCGLPVPCDLDFDTELVYKAFTKLKRGKAADIFG